MTLVKSKYFSPRAIGLHVVLILWMASCAMAAWWQVGRAIHDDIVLRLQYILHTCLDVVDERCEYV